jgi:hypothetical protein
MGKQPKLQVVVFFAFAYNRFKLASKLKAA